MFSLNKRIALGSEDLWSVISEKLEEAVKAGILK